MIRGMVDNYFAGVPFSGIGRFGKVKGHKIFLSNANSDLFNYYAGKTHQQLKAAWEGSKPRLTTCNGLAGLMFNRLFASKKKGINGLKFELQAQCLASAPLAWVSQSENPEARPRYGDVMSYKPPKLHASVCLGADQSSWNVIQSGQGGKSVGVDIIAKGREVYPFDRIVGWINVAILWDYDEIARAHGRSPQASHLSPWEKLMQKNRAGRQQRGWRA